jgi:regulator of nucleoside diphosphate kinase
MIMPGSPERRWYPDTSVSINSRVRFKYLSTREQREYTLVFPGEADIEGIALLGASVGDVVECHAPAGVRRLRIEEILYQPEAAGFFYV